MIIACDFHPASQTIAMLDPATGEVTTRRLEHCSDEVRGFYQQIPRGATVVAEATGHLGWFRRLLSELGHGADCALTPQHSRVGLSHSAPPGAEPPSAPPGAEPYIAYRGFGAEPHTAPLGASK